MLPPIPDLAAYRALRKDAAIQRPAITVIAERHGLATSELAPFATGTNLVWGTRDEVIKLFVPLWPEDADVEVAMLETVTGTDLPAPQLHALGELDGWRYAVMSRVRGVRIGDIWSALPPQDRELLAFRAGEVIARIAELPAARLEARTCHQDALLAERLPCVRADQRERGGDDGLDAQLCRFLDALSVPPPAESVVLHADLTDDHFLVEGTSITGIIDFADAFVGPWTYELAAPACFLTRGSPAVRDALLRGRGVAPEPGILAAIRTWAVLHRYGHLAIMMRRAGTASLDGWLATL